ncbi:MAG: Asp-tRNA(Asn)/Glu-tRNA(Gln) amidotransferase subunit GatA [Minisyncoccus archaeiphilus]|jgi:aspartyl-tRNA(Asn)/glutamyl-tRNA(Gln) amidotransferase subunit A|nr:MAG: Asp-tRNA(Asn)/Glu-tRNA(Gln) amidotransferase subunit GatA [Candidatus Parcubacteria bacterium]
MINLNNLTIKKAHDHLKNKDFSSVELTKSYLDKIREKDIDIKAYLSITEDLAITQASKVDRKIANDEDISFLEGIPCSIKDNIMIRGERCTAGSKFLDNYTAIYDANVVEKLSNAGAVFLGKVNLDEFAMGGSCEKSAFFPTRNPHDLERVPGGSSGGSAASVAGDLCMYSLGSDTGGSIRQPASFCGVVGLKPTYGTVSRYGLIAFASSLDQIGPIGKTVDDCEVIFNTIKGVDKRDSTSTDYEVLGLEKKNWRIGVPKEYFGEGLNEEVKKAVQNKISLLEKNGAEIVEISLPHTDYALACYYIIAPSEASANLARFDGLRYGTQGLSEDIHSINDLYLDNRTAGFGKEVKKRIMLGTYTLSSGYYDAYYKKALKVRTLVKRDFEDAFKDVDFIIGPTSPCLPFKIGEMEGDPLAMYLADIYTVSINLAGIPAISIPCGKSVSGLPIGLQIIAPAFQEKALFDIARSIEDRL